MFRCVLGGTLGTHICWSDKYLVEPFVRQCNVVYDRVPRGTHIVWEKGSCEVSPYRIPV